MIAPDESRDRERRAEQAEQILHPAAREAFENSPEGWRLYPIRGLDSGGNCTCRNGAKCESPGKHPATRNGVNDASSDLHDINRLFANKPGCNVGLETGRESGVAVFDVDPRHDGMPSLRELIAKHGGLPLTREHASGGGGLHIFFTYPGELASLKSRILAPGVELKADGAGIVLPPSVHTSRRLYRVLNDAPLAPLPGWVYERRANLEVIEGANENRDKQGESRFALPGVIGEGSRNTTLFKYACSLRAHGWDYPDIIEEIRQVNGKRCTPPIEDAEVRKTTRSACRYPPGRAFKVSPEALRRIAFLEETYPKIKKGAADHSDWAMFHAAADLSALFGSLHRGSDIAVQASVRQLALWSGLSLKTASTSLKRLEEKEQIYRVWRGSGGKPGIIALRVPETDLSTTFRPPPPEGVDTVVSTSVAKELRGLRHVAGGIGKAAGAALLEILENPGIHRTELAMILGKKPDSLSRTLKRLFDFGLVERVSKGRYHAARNWQTILDRERMRTGERLIEQRDTNRYERDRAAYRMHLAEREARPAAGTSRYGIQDRY